METTGGGKVAKPDLFMSVVCDNRLKEAAMRRCRTMKVRHPRTDGPGGKAKAAPGT